MWGTPSTTPAFGTPSTPAFGTPSSTPGFGVPSSSPGFGTPSTFPAFGASSAPAFGGTSTGGFGLSLFSTSSPFSQQTQQQQMAGQTPSPSPFGLQPFAAHAAPAATPASPFGSTFPAANTQQLMTQMAPMTPLPVPLVDRDVTAIVDTYKDDPGNPKYAFRHLLFSVTDPAARVKPLGVSDIMWAEAMATLEGMESSQREKLWPQLVQGFKDLSVRLKLQDEVLVSDSERLRTTQANVKMLQRHHQADTIPWIQRLRQQEQSLQRRLLRVMRIIEALECRGLRIPFNKAEGSLADKLGVVARQLKVPGPGLSPRAHNLLSLSRMRANAGAVGSSFHLPGSAKIYENGLTDLQDVLQQQNEAIARLGNVLKRDIRDMEIIKSEDTDMLKDGRMP